MKVKLGDIFDISSGGTPSKSHPEYYGGDIPWVKTGDLKSEYLYKVEDFITEDGLKHSSAKLYGVDTVLIAMYGATIGNTSILKMSACTNQACAAFKKNDRVIPEYLYFFLRSQKERFVRDGVGGAQPNISAGYLKNIEMELPALEEQRIIVDVLNKLVEIIEKRNQELEKMDELVKSRFMELFGDPVSNPMGWQVKRLKQISSLITNGNTPKGGSENYVTDGIMFLRSQNVWRNRIELDDVAYIDESTHLSMAKSRVHDKDILITKTGRINTENSSLGRAALFRGADNSANINGHIYLVRLNESVVPEYVVAILTGESYRRYIRRVCVGGIDKRQINLDQVENFPIILPPKESQEKFSAFVEQVDKSKLAVQKSLDELETLKKSLMQQYFG